MKGAGVLATLAAVGALMLFASRADAGSNLAANLIRETERLQLTPYQDDGGTWHIGYGRSFGDTRPAVESITRETAERWLQEDMATARRAVDDLVTVSLNEKQKAALISFVYNLGRGAFANSTLLRKLNAGDYSGAAAEFSRWIHVAGTPSSGLATRREAERRLFAA